MPLSVDEKKLPPEVYDQLCKIDESDVFKYYDGVDTEGPSFKFHNSLNAFRSENQVEIRLHDYILKGAKPVSLETFVSMLNQITNKNMDSLKKRRLFEEDF